MTAETAVSEFVISRTFDAPRNAVFAAWCDAGALAQWWGPKGFAIEVARFDLKPGGMFLYAMKTGAQEMWGRFVYREIVAPERLVYVNSFSDLEGNITRAPFFDGRWPLEVLNTMTFTEEGGVTTLELRATPLDANADETAAFVENHAGMRGGFGGTLDQLAEFLAPTKT